MAQEIIKGGLKAIKGATKKPKIEVINKATGKKVGGTYSRAEVEDFASDIDRMTKIRPMAITPTGKSLGFTEKSLDRDLRDFVKQMDARAITPEGIAENYSRRKKKIAIYSSPLLQSLKSFPKEQRKAILKKAKELYKNSPKKFAILAALFTAMDEEEAEASAKGLSISTLATMPPKEGVVSPEDEMILHAQDQQRLRELESVVVDYEYLERLKDEQEVIDEQRDEHAAVYEETGQLPFRPRPLRSKPQEEPGFWNALKEIGLGAATDAVKDIFDLGEELSHELRDIPVPLSEMDLGQLMDLWGITDVGATVGKGVDQLQIERRGGPVTQTLRGITEFFMGFKLIKALKWFRQAKGAGDIAAAGLTAGIVIDPDQPNFGNALRDMPPETRQAITDYMLEVPVSPLVPDVTVSVPAGQAMKPLTALAGTSAHDPGESRLRRRLNNMWEDTMLTAFIEPVFQGLKFLKSMQPEQLKAAKRTEVTAIVDKKIRKIDAELRKAKRSNAADDEIERLQRSKRRAVRQLRKLQGKVETPTKRAKPFVTKKKTETYDPDIEPMPEVFTAVGKQYKTGPGWVQDMENFGVNFGRVVDGESAKQAYADFRQMIKDDLLPQLGGKVTIEDLTVQTIAKLEGKSLEDAYEMLRQSKSDDINPVDTLAVNVIHAMHLERMQRLVGDVIFSRAEGVEAHQLAKLDFARAFGMQKHIELLKQQYSHEWSVTGLAHRVPRDDPRFPLALKTGDSPVPEFDVAEATAAYKELVDRLPEGFNDWDVIADKFDAYNSSRQYNTFWKQMRDVNQSTYAQKMMTIWLNGLLSGVQTHVVNNISNAFMAGWSIPEIYMSSAIGKLRGTEDAVTLEEANAYVWGMMRGAVDGFIMLSKSEGKRAADELIGPMSAQTNIQAGGVPKNIGRWFTGKEVEVSEHQKLEGYFRNNNLTAENWGPMSPGWSKFTNLLAHLGTGPQSALMISDDYFKGMSYRAKLHQLAKREAESYGGTKQDQAKRYAQILERPSQYLTKEAEKHAREMTFTKELGPLMKQLQSATEVEIWGLPLKLMSPFIRTPTDIAKALVERTPLGLLKTVESHEGQSAWRTVLQQGGREADMVLAKVATGSMAMVASVGYAMDGRITGGGPRDKNLRAALLRTGWQPYSMRVFDPVKNKYVYRAYNRLDPWAGLMGLAADYVEINHFMTDQEREKIGNKFIYTIAKNVTSKTYMKGIGNFFEVMERGEDSRFKQGFAGSLVPSIVGAAARVMDPEMKDIHGMLAKIKSRVPGFSDEVPTRLNLWGDEVLYSNGWAPEMVPDWVGRFASPIYESYENKEPIDEEMIQHRLSVGMPSRFIEQEPLTDQEYHDYVKLAGKIKIGEAVFGDSIEVQLKPNSDLYFTLKFDQPMDVKTFLNHLVVSPAYLEATKENPDLDISPKTMKEKIIRVVLGAYREAAEDEMLSRSYNSDLNLFNRITKRKMHLQLEASPN